MKRSLVLLTALLIATVSLGLVTGVKTPPSGTTGDVQINGNGVFSSTDALKYSTSTHNLALSTGTVTIGTTTVDGSIHIAVPYSDSATEPRVMRLDVNGYEGDGGDGYIPSAELLAVYSNSKASTETVRRWSLQTSVIPDATADIILRDQNNVAIHDFSMRNAENAHAGSIGYTAGTAGYVYGNQINVQGSIGLAGIAIEGSTEPINYTIYRVNTSTGPSVITMPNGGIVGGIGSRYYRFCKSDSSTNTVRVAPTGGFNPTTLNYQGECVDYWDYIAAADDSSGQWFPIGRSYWNDISVSTITASSITVSGQLQTPTLKFGDGTTMTTAASGSGSSPFTNAIATTAINMGGFAINNSSAIVTSSITIVGATWTVNGVTFINPSTTTLGTSTSLRLLAYDPVTKFVSFPDALYTVSASTGLTGTLAAANFPALTGNVTTSAGSLATTIASVPNAAVDSSSITKQGNQFGAASQLVKADSNAYVPNAQIDPSSVTKLGPSITLDELSGGVSGANSYDFGGSTSMEMPNGTNPTVSTTGQFALDTSSGQVVVSTNGSNVVVIPTVRGEPLVIESPAVGDFPFYFRPLNDITVDSLVCISSAATSATVQIFECDANGANCTAINTAAACTTSNTALTVTDSSIAAGNWVRARVTAVSGTPGWTAVDLYIRETRK